MTEIKINRAPVLTLWASVVARRLGFDEDESLSPGRALSGLTAQSKGRRLGIYRARSIEDQEALREEREEMHAKSVVLMDRQIPCLHTPDGLRALKSTTPIEPESVRTYLAGRFEDHLGEVEELMSILAGTCEPEDLDRAAMDLYMRFRPNVPKGREGWGKTGLLKTEMIEALTAGRVS